MPVSARHIEIGQRGEQVATSYLLGLGWMVLARNWRGARGELDIIARDGDVLVFVEVKSRQNAPAEEAFMQVSQRKQAALIRTAEDYLNAHDLAEIQWRIDVIAVIFGRGAPLIEHVQDALLW